MVQEMLFKKDGPLIKARFSAADLEADASSSEEVSIKLSESDSDEEQAPDNQANDQQP